MVVLNRLTESEVVTSCYSSADSAVVDSTVEVRDRSLVVADRIASKKLDLVVVMSKVMRNCQCGAAAEVEGRNDSHRQLPAVDTFPLVEKSDVVIVG